MSKRKKKSAASNQIMGPPPPYRKGAIVRVKMYQFLTYSSAEVYPGPRLNVVVGPNGTGKSSIVCAICLGLAGSTKSLVRAEQTADYVKKGESEGFIELELYKAGKNGENITIKRTLTLDNKSTWHMNGKASNARRVKKLAEELNIQVDNLCVFLAQERVNEFAKLKPTDLLVQTQKAASPKLYQQHEQLIELRKKDIKAEKEVQEKQQALQLLENAQASLKQDVEAFKQRQEFTDKARLLKLKLPWAEYYQVKKDLAPLKADLAKCKAELEEEGKKLEPSHVRIEAARSKLGKAKLQVEQTKRAFNKLEGEREKVHGKLQALEDEHEDLAHEIKSAERNARTRAERLAKAKRDLEEAQQAVDACRSSGDLKAAREEGKKQKAKLRTNLRQLGDQAENIRYDADQHRNQIQRLQREINGFKDVKQVMMKRMMERSRGRDKAVGECYKWVQKNMGAFKQPVYGPVFLELNVANQLHAKYLENHVSKSVKMGYVVQNKEDWQRLVKEFGNHNWTFSVYAVGQYSPPRRAGGLQRLKEAGLTGFLDEVVQCNDKVKQCLMDVANVHRAGFTTSDNVDPSKCMKQSHSDTNGIQMLYMPNEVVQVKFSKYGQKDRSACHTPLRPCWLLSSSGQDGDAAKKRQEMEVQLRALQDKLKPVDAQLAKLHKQQSTDQAQLSKLDKEMTNLVKEARAAQRRARAVQQARTRLQVAESTGEDVQVTKQRLEKKRAGINRKRMDLMKQAVGALHKWQEAARAQAAPRLNLVTQQAVVEQIEEELKHMTQGLKRFQTAVDAAKQRHKQCTSLALEQKKTAMKACSQQVFKDQLQEEWMMDSPEDIKQEMIRFEAQADMVIADKNVVELFNKRQREIDSKRQELGALQADHNDDREKMAKLRDEWEPALHKVVGVVDTRFRQYFEGMGCKGKVVLASDDSYDNYRLEIHVAFRKSEELRVLSSTSQSGGERSVSTMLFLLCLQSVTDCPFRVVDEINQGMDAHNERMIFDQIVETCCMDGHNDSPQYFLVTPKLLPNLKYKGHINVLFIYNGPWQLDSDQFDLKKFIEKLKKQKRKKVKRVR